MIFATAVPFGAAAFSLQTLSLSRLATVEVSLVETGLASG
jgi:hypothetical protein